MLSAQRLWGRKEPASARGQGGTPCSSDAHELGGAGTWEPWISLIGLGVTEQKTERQAPGRVFEEEQAWNSTLCEGLCGIITTTALLAAPGVPEGHHLQNSRLTQMHGSRQRELIGKITGLSKIAS